MKLLTNDIRARLLANGKRQDPVRGTPEEIDFLPVVKLFTPDAGATWLLTELGPEEPDIAFGLCDLGLQCPELGSVRISEIESVRGAIGLPVERDRFFEAIKPLSVYAEAARSAGTHPAFGSIAARLSSASSTMTSTRPPKPLAAISV